MSTANPPSSDSLIASRPSSVRPLDERLTLTAIRMTYIAFSVGFLAFYFAHAYLEIVNSNGLWLPKLLRISIGYGVVEVVLPIIALLSILWGWRSTRSEEPGNKLFLGLIGALVFGLAAFVLHVVELHAPATVLTYTGKKAPTFSLQDGGFASIFIATEALYTVILGLVVIVLAGLTNRARLRLFTESTVAVAGFTELWGWLAVVGVLNFLGLWVQPYFPIA